VTLLDRNGRAMPASGGPAPLRRGLRCWPALAGRIGRRQGSAFRGLRLIRGEAGQAGHHDVLRVPAWQRRACEACVARR